MDENKKYEIVGKVEIGTDEYRDLIESNVKHEREASEYRSKFWSCESERDKLKEKVEALEKSVAHYREFVNESEDRQSAYKLFLSSKIED